MPLNLGAFEKNASTASASTSRRKWQPPSKPKEAGNDKNGNGSGSSSANAFNVQLKKTPSRGSSSATSGPSYGGLKKTPSETGAGASTSNPDETTAIEEQKKQLEEPMEHTDSTAATAATEGAAMDTAKEAEEIDDQMQPKVKIEERESETETNNSTRKQVKNKKPTTSNRKSSRKYVNPFALTEADLKKSARKKRTKGTFDWSDVDRNIKSILPEKNEEVQSKKTKLQEKLNHIESTKREALKQMHDHVIEQKFELDEKRNKIRKQFLETTRGMTYEQMINKVKENHEIVATLKKSNQKLRTEVTKLRGQIHNLRINNAKLEAANEQSMNVLAQLEDRKKSVDARYEHLTKVIIPPYMERIAEMKEVVMERKLYGINENRTKIRYGNYIIRFLDKVDQSEESKRLKEEIFQMGMHVEGGDLSNDWGEDSEKEDDDDAAGHVIGIDNDVSGDTATSTEKNNPQKSDNNISESSLDLNDMPSISDDASTHKSQSATANIDGDAANSNSKTASFSSSFSKPQQVKEERSLWDRYGAGASKSNLDASNKGIGECSSGHLAKHADILQKVSRQQAANFNGAVILSDSDSDEDDDDSDDDISVGSDDS